MPWCEICGVVTNVPLDSQSREIEMERCPKGASFPAILRQRCIMSNFFALQVCVWPACTLARECCSPRPFMHVWVSDGGYRYFHKAAGDLSSRRRTVLYIDLIYLPQDGHHGGVEVGTGPHCCPRSRCPCRSAPPHGAYDIFTRSSVAPLPFLPPPPPPLISLCVAWPSTTILRCAGHSGGHRPRLVRGAALRLCPPRGHPHCNLCFTLCDRYRPPCIIYLKCLAKRVTGIGSVTMPRSMGPVCSPVKGRNFFSAPTLHVSHT